MPKQNEGHRSQILLSHLAGDEGFEPPITGPEPVALPLGQSPITLIITKMYDGVRIGFDPPDYLTNKFYHEKLYAMLKILNGGMNYE